MLWIPPGFAHGFQALEDTYFLYLVTKEYSPQHERCIKWDDPEIGIQWPLKEGGYLERERQEVSTTKASRNKLRVLKRSNNILSIACLIERSSKRRKDIEILKEKT